MKNRSIYQLENVFDIKCNPVFGSNGDFKITEARMLLEDIPLYYEREKKKESSV